MAGTGVVLSLAGAAVATRAIEQMGLALVLLAGLAVFVVRLGRHEITVTRTVAPERVGTGRPVRVTIDLANDGRGSTPLLLVEDKVPPQLTGKARFAFSGIEPTGRRRARFELRPQRRGRYEVGPLEIMYVDPFGLARVVAHSEGRTPFLVHPKIERLSLPRDRGERRSLAVSARRQPTGSRSRTGCARRCSSPSTGRTWPRTIAKGAYTCRGRTGAALA